MPFLTLKVVDSVLEQTFSESTRKTGLMTWGVKTILLPLQGLQKRFPPVLGGVGPYKTPEKPILTLKMVDSALEHTFSESTQSTGLMTWGSKPSYAHCKGSEKDFPPFLEGGVGVTVGPFKASKNSKQTFV
jgi:hypothetical protein